MWFWKLLIQYSHPFIYTWYGQEKWQRNWGLVSSCWTGNSSKFLHQEKEGLYLMLANSTFMNFYQTNKNLMKRLANKKLYYMNIDYYYCTYLFRPISGTGATPIGCGLCSCHWSNPILSSGFFSSIADSFQEKVLV